MTETITHVAMQRLNHPHKHPLEEDHFIALEGVVLSTQDDCLVIHADHLDEQEIVTTDVVDLIDEKRFIWKGRADHVINRGGLKLHPRAIEGKLDKVLSARCFIAKRSSEAVGEEPVLVIEGGDRSLDYLELIRPLLPKLWLPADVILVDKLLETPTGKIIRDLSQYDLPTN